MTDETVACMGWSISAQEQIDGFRKEVRELKAENAALRTQLADVTESMGRVEERCARLRELVRDMYGFIKRMDEDCGDVTFSDCFDYCKHDTAGDGCCKTGECWYERSVRELGIGVDADA